MQKHRFEIWFADIHRADLDAALVGFGNDRREDLFGGWRDNRHSVPGCFGMLHTLNPLRDCASVSGSSFSPTCRMSVSVSPNLLCEFLLCAKRNEFAVVNDADAVRKFLSFFHVMRCVKHGHALLVEVFDRIENRAA